MADICDFSINQDFMFDCDNPNAAGLLNEVLLFNFDDIDRTASVVTTTSGEPIIESIVLKSTKRGYIVQQKMDSFNGTKWEQVAGTYGVNFTHTLAFVSFDRSPVAKDNIQKLLNGRFVAIIHNKNAPEKSKYEVLGWHTGLGKTGTATQDYVAAEGAAAIPITLASDQEPQLPMSFYKTSLAATDAAFEALKTAATAGI